MTVLCHPLHNNFDISVTSQQTVINPTGKTTSQLEQFCIEQLQVSAWGQQGIPEPWDGEEIKISSHDPLTKDNRQSQSGDWWSFFHYKKLFWQWASLPSLFPLPTFLFPLPSSLFNCKVFFLFSRYEFLAFGRRYYEYSSRTCKFLWQNLIILPIKLS